MIDQDDMYIEAQEELEAEFEEKHGRLPNAAELSRIQDQLFDKVRDRMADMVDHVYDTLKERDIDRLP